MKYLRVSALLGSVVLLISCGKSHDKAPDVTNRSAAAVASSDQKSANVPSNSATDTDEVKIEPTPVPPNTFKDDGACPTEGCIYREWKAEATIPVYAQPDASSPVVFSLQRGEWVTAINGFVLTTEPGIFEILEDLDTPQYHLPVGAKVYVYTMEGEGYDKAWFGGEFFQFEEPGTDKARLVKEPKSTWWVQVRNSLNVDGWTLDALHFSNNDQLANP